MISFSAYFAKDSNFHPSTPHSIMIEVSNPKGPPVRQVIDLIPGITYAQIGQAIAACMEEIEKGNQKEKKLEFI